MSRGRRSDIFDPLEISVMHCINRCVRQGFLCGVDEATGIDFGHRREWILHRMQWLARWYGIDVLAYSILKNHYHVILRNRPDVVARWSNEDVAYHWLMLCPIRKKDDGTPEEPHQHEIRAIARNRKRIKKLRKRLSDISWWMRMLAEDVARRANKEERKKGRFWQGRFKSTKLCDEAAMLAGSIYVDLNLIRAGASDSIEGDRFTSAGARLEAHQTCLPDTDTKSPEDHRLTSEWLAPIQLDETATPGPQVSTTSFRASDKGYLPHSLADYVKLLDWTARQPVEGKASLPNHLTPILQRLGISQAGWLELTSRFDRLFYRAAGSRQSLQLEAARRKRRWYQAPGKSLLSRNAT